MIRLYINLLNYGSYEEIGKEVIRLLLESKIDKFEGVRQIIVFGS